jgi:hypothetical protein
MDALVRADGEPPHPNRWPRQRWLGAGLVLLGLLVVLAYLLPFDQVCGYGTSVDISAGRYRRQVFVAGLEVQRTVRDSALTDAYREVVGPPPEPVWRTAGGGKPGLSINHLYFGETAASAVDTVSMSLAAGNFTAKAKRTAVLTFLQLLQTDEDYHRASQYADSINDLVCENGRTGAIGEEELPNVP